MIEVLAQNKSIAFVDVGMNVDFMLSEGVFVRAKSKENLEKIALWLGANTIV